MKKSLPSNRLAREKSPYLLQHAHNPVDWYPWGAEAFEKARRENKPILLSIGYSTCHWCHVMEKECFENPEIAAVMNKYLVSIKLDREERPDIDKIYMTAVTAMTGAGGWPLNVFLTPDLKPFVGGTYFPPEDRHGRIGWPNLVEKIGLGWQQPAEQQKMLHSGDQILEALRQYLGESGAPEDFTAEAAQGVFQSLAQSYDGERGGFSFAPKFPMPVNLFFLLRYHEYLRPMPGREEDSQSSLKMVLGTLEAMARGGIYDHLGGGFSRYSTDEHWRLPHFEKMLYDNAQLAVAYLEAYQITGRSHWLRTARETLEYLRRDLRHPEGGFFSAEDADSPGPENPAEKKEGAFYLWAWEEIQSLLGKERAEIFQYKYGLEPNGNLPADPFGEFEGKNILFEARTTEETALRFKKTLEETSDVLEECRSLLFKARANRPRPFLDDKVITAWNGLALSAFARAAQITGEKIDRETAGRTAEFIRKNLYSPDEGLFRRWREGENKIPAMSDDYAFLVQGLLDLYETDFEDRWLEWAMELSREMLGLFYEESTNGFYITANSSSERDSPLRAREEADNVEPSAASVAALNLFRLADLTEQEEWRRFAEKILTAYVPLIKAQPRSLPYMAAAGLWALGRTSQIKLRGDPAAPAFKELLVPLRRRFLPFKTLRRADTKGSVQALVCAGKTCFPPVSKPDDLIKLLA